jgi:hypothetical protein
MAEFSGPRAEMAEPRQALCAAYRRAEDNFRQQWQAAIGDSDRRQQLRKKIDALSRLPLGDALQAFTEVDLEEHREHLNALPQAVQNDLVASAVDALEKGLDLRVSLAYSGGSTGAEVTRWYAGGDARPALVDVRVICPE